MAVALQAPQTDAEWYLDLLHWSSSKQPQIALSRKPWDELWPFPWPYGHISWWQRFYSYAPATKQLLLDKINGIEETDLGLQTYVSMNAFQWLTVDGRPQIHREQRHLVELRALYADLDVYSVGLTQQEALARLECQYFDLQVPRPTLVVDSGRGIYCIWLLDHPYGAGYMEIWRAINGRLTSALSLLGADPHVGTDVARVLRLPGSMNAKNGRVAAVIQYNDRRFGLEELFESLPQPAEQPTSEADARKRPKVDKASKAARRPKQTYPIYDDRETEIRRLLSPRVVQRGNVAHIWNEKTRVMAILRDLQTLVELRGREMTYCREILLWLQRLHAHVVQDLDSVQDLNEQTNEGFATPLSSVEAWEATSSAEVYGGRRERWLNEHTNHDSNLKDAVKKACRTRSGADWDAAIELSKQANYACFRLRNATLIRLLSITPDEQRHLEHIISSGEKARRNAEAHRMSRRGQDGLTDAQRTRQASIAKARDMHAAGMSQREIAANLGITDRTVHNWLSDKSGKKTSSFIGEGEERGRGNNYSPRRAGDAVGVDSSMAV